MAEDKKSVLMYCDLIHTFEELTDDEAGRLIKHFFRYVNDQNPEYPDKLTKLLFQPIKGQLKRDLEKWQEVKVTRSESGSLGNLKRWHNDLYKKITKGELTTDEAINIAKDRKPSQGDKINRKVSQSIANVAVNDNVTVNVKDKVINKDISDFDLAFNSFVDMRKKIKRPATPRALELVRKELDKLAPENKELQVQIINQSIRNSWQDVFPLKRSESNFAVYSQITETNVKPLANNEW